MRLRADSRNHATITKALSKLTTIALYVALHFRTCLGQPTTRERQPLTPCLDQRHLRHIQFVLLSLVNHEVTQNGYGWRVQVCRRWTIMEQH